MQLCFAGHLWVGCNICAYPAAHYWFTWGWPSTTSKVPHGTTSPSCAAHLLFSLSARPTENSGEPMKPCWILDSWFSSTTLCYMNFLKAPVHVQLLRPEVQIGFCEYCDWKPFPPKSRQFLPSSFKRSQQAAPSHSHHRVQWEEQHRDPKREELQESSVIESQCMCILYRDLKTSNQKVHLPAGHLQALLVATLAIRSVFKGIGKFDRCK